VPEGLRGWRAEEGVGQVVDPDADVKGVRRGWTERTVWSLLNFNIAIMEEANVVGLNFFITTPAKLEIGGLFSRLDLPSTLIRHAPKRSFSN